MLNDRPKGRLCLTHLTIPDFQVEERPLAGSQGSVSRHGCSILDGTHATPPVSQRTLFFESFGI